MALREILNQTKPLARCVFVATEPVIRYQNAEFIREMKVEIQMLDKVDLDEFPPDCPCGCPAHLLRGEARGGETPDRHRPSPLQYGMARLARRRPAGIRGALHDHDGIPPRRAGEDPQAALHGPPLWNQERHGELRARRQPRGHRRLLPHLLSGPTGSSSAASSSTRSPRSSSSTLIMPTSINAAIATG